MRLLVIGCGQCGGRIADEFARLNRKAHAQRNIEIVTNSLAVNTDICDLTGLAYIRPDYQHRILIGDQKTGGHGVGKINELGAEIAKDDAEKIVEGIKTTPHYHETDAFLIIASAAGGTGSGSIPVLTKHLKELYVDKPIYNMIVLPFKHEEKVEERTIYNTATCLKSTYLVADAVFLVDNQHYVRKYASIQNTLQKINSVVTEPFYNLLCAGEEKDPKHIGAKILDAGDIIQTLSGWTVIGHGKQALSAIKLPFGGSDFRDKTAQIKKGTQAMDDALSELSLRANAADAKRALYLISAPQDSMSINLINEIGSNLKKAASEAIIRSGDYPRETHTLEITLLLSELVNVERVMEYFTKAIRYMASYKKRWEGIEDEQRNVEDAFRDIPSLL